jgi:hypothetical protein
MSLRLQYKFKVDGCWSVNKQDQLTRTAEVRMRKQPLPTSDIHGRTFSLHGHMYAVLLTGQL